jgi:hypothetical protein
MNLEIFSNLNLQRRSTDERQELLNELSTILTNRTLCADRFVEDVKKHHREKYEQ